MNLKTFYEIISEGYKRLPAGELCLCLRFRRLSAAQLQQAGEQRDDGRRADGEDPEAWRTEKDLPGGILRPGMVRISELLSSRLALASLASIVVSSALILRGRAKSAQKACSIPKGTQAVINLLHTFDRLQFEIGIGLPEEAVPGEAHDQAGHLTGR